MSISTTSVVPFRLKGEPSLIERMMPSTKLSIEAQKERKAGSGQTLTALGSYWKGRKPLVLVRACVLGALLPATDQPEKDLEVFELLMAMHDESFATRDTTVSLKDLYELSPPGMATNFVVETTGGRTQVQWAKHLSKQEILAVKASILAKLSYEDRVGSSLRPEELGSEAYDAIWSRVNSHLGTTASSLAELVHQLGILRFGRTPHVADTFSGGGSIPFEAARIGCVAQASDLNPIACMLTWGAFNVIGATATKRDANEKFLQEGAATVERKVQELGFETDAQGNRAKSFLYCLEAKLPDDTGWTVPICQSWVVSEKRRIVIVPIPNHKTKAFDFELVEKATDEQMRRARKGTKQGEYVVYEIDGIEHRVAIRTIRGDYRDRDGQSKNRLRLWAKEDIEYRPDDIFRERLYCIQWILKDSLGKGRQDTVFRVPVAADLEREARVSSYVSGHLAEWQQAGFVPDMPIEEGEKTSEPIRTRGWTYWHHLFAARNLLTLALIAEQLRSQPVGAIRVAHQANWNSKGCQWFRGFDTVNHTFEDQSLKTKFDYGVRSSYVFTSLLKDRSSVVEMHGTGEVRTGPASSIGTVNDIYITDPPYADAVNYHEITEFFIAWLRKNPPPEFADWNWDSRRLLAIKGKGEEFRASMVEAYKAMADHMSENGVQIVMFTHQDGKVWSDMAQIFWGAGLQVMADWYIATETTSELKKGGYVQGTHIIVLRKRGGNESGYSDEITQEVKEEVARQIEEMVGLNQSLRGHGRSENLFNDADLQMAGYAAALRVLTKYVKIDGKDMTVEALRPRSKNERTVIDDIIEYAVQVANEHLVPEGMPEATWRKLSGTERFYLKMMDIETTGSKKVDNYQNFAKAFRVGDYGALMSSVSANEARLKTAANFGKRQMGDDEFGSSLTRAVLYALWEMGAGVGDDVVLGHLRDLATNYLDQRGDLLAIATYIASKRQEIDVAEAKNATILSGLIKNERLG